MRVRELKKKQLVRRPLEEVFEFFQRPENLAVITPPSMGFVILSPSPLTMRAGAVIDYTVRVFGIRVRWTSLISDYEPPHRFVDTQLRGPYSFWHHTHTFEQVEDGTVIVDHVRYILPLGILGRLVNRLIVKRQLESIFKYRARAIAERFGETESVDLSTRTTSEKG